MPKKPNRECPNYHNMSDRDMIIRTCQRLDTHLEDYDEVKQEVKDHSKWKWILFGCVISFEGIPKLMEVIGEHIKGK